MVSSLFLIKHEVITDMKLDPCKRMLCVFLGFPLLKNVFPLVPSVGHLSFTVQNDVCVEFDTRQLF